MDDIAAMLGMTREQALAFRAHLEELKASGEVGSANDRGDFTYRELRTLGYEFLGEL